MDNINKFYKVLRIIFLTLAIFSLVFTLCKKVGLCASSDPLYFPADSFPLRFGIGSNLGYSSLPLTDSDCAAILNWAQNELYSGYDTICFYQVSGATSITVYVTDYDVAVLASNNPNDFSPSHCVVNYGKGGYINYNLSTGYCSYSGTHNNPVLNLRDSVTYVSGSYVLSYNTDILYYPIYSSFSTISASNTEIFTSSGGSSSDDDFYESIQGELTDIFEKTNIISGLASDMTTVSLFERLYYWLLGFQDTVYKGYNMLWQNFKTLFKPLVDNAANFFQWFHDKYSDIADFIYGKWLDLFDALGLTGNQTIADFLDYLELIYNFLTGQGNVTLQGVIEDALDSLFGQGGKLSKIKEIYDWFYTHGLKNGEFDFITLWDYLFEYDEQVVYTQLKSSRYGAFILSCKTEMTSFFTALTSVTAADHVQFTIPIGTTLGGVQIPDIVIDFDWYADIRDTFLPWFMAFLYVSVIWCFWKSLPNIIHGVAGDVSTFTDALGGEEFAPTSHGVFTHGVSHNQPSLDKAPLSGGGGVHSGASQFWY